MSAPMESEQLEDPEFKWVKKRGVGGKNKDVRFYESFTYDGMDYALYDCVYMHKQGEPVPYIGKLVKIWETAEGTKKIKVHWFFRPSEISYYLKDAKVLESELFFASGDGKGLTNINPVEAIAGKCNVVCTSADSRNPQPSAEELQMADYVFYRIFDVKSCTISDQMDDKIGGLELNFVFNRREGVGTLVGPKLDACKKYGLKVVAFKETPQIAGNSSPQQLNNMKLDKNGNHALEEEEDTHAKQVLVKQEGKPFSGVDAISSKNKEITGATTLEERSTTGAKNVGSNICEKKDNLKDIVLPVKQVHVEKGVKHASKSCNLDDASSKRAKVDASVSSDSNGVQGVKDSVGCRKDVKLSENLSPLDENLSKTGVSLSKEASRSGHAVGLQENSKTNGNLNALQGKTNAVSSSEKENSGSAHRKDSCVAQKDKKIGGNLRSCGEKTSETNLVSRDATQRPSMTNASPEETPKSIPAEEFEGSQQVTKPTQSLSTSRKRPLEKSAGESKEKLSPVHDKSHENKEKALGSNACPKDEGYLKKAKLDNSIKRSEENKNNNIKKLKTKTYVGETKNSPKIATSSDNNAKSRPGEGSSKEYRNGKEKNNVSEMKNPPKSLTCDNKAMSKLGKGPSKEYHNEKDDKLSNDNLPSPIATKSKDDGGKVGGKIIEVTPRPPEKATWIKLSWEQQMKIAHDHGKLVLLQNLDPEYTSGEVEDIIWHTFKENCTARMLPHIAISNPYYGQAFVVFKSKDAANKVVHKLADGCLILPNQRPLVACHGVLPKVSEKQTAYAGHLVIDKDRRQMQRSMKAVSTSHYSQNNTIEFEMAMEWCLLQSRSDKWWKNLYELQRKELKKHTDNLKSN